MTGFGVKPLDAATWPDFALLVEMHNGVWGGCWCMAFHAEGVGRTRTAAQNRSEKECRVREGRAHAALVYDGETCVGWCQFGPTDELPASSTDARTSRVSPPSRSGGSPASSSTRGTGARVSPRPRSGALSRRSPGSGAERWRAIPRTSRAGRPLDRFSTTAPFDVRASWVRANPSNRQAPLGRRQGGRQGALSVDETGVVVRPATGWSREASHLPANQALSAPRRRTGAPRYAHKRLA